MLCSCTNPIFGEIFVPEIWAKMFSANQIAGFFNQPYLQNKLMPGFLHVETNLHKLKLIKIFFGVCGQKWVWPVWSQDSKIGCISRMNWWNELIFCMVVQIQESKQLFQWFLGSPGQKWVGSFSSWGPKICW